MKRLIVLLALLFVLSGVAFASPLSEPDPQMNDIPCWLIPYPHGC